MGNGIAHNFAQFNFNVQLIDVSQKALDKSIANKRKRYKNVRFNNLRKP